MAEQTSDSVNLDLNLGPIAIRTRSRLQWRSQNLLVLHPESQNIPMGLNQFVETPSIRTTLQVGRDGVLETDLRSEDVTKECEHDNGLIRDGELQKADDVGKGIGDHESFFDCNICLGMAKDPVVTCCGHLFCWPCLYKWLHMHSAVKECPVCKGEVSYNTVTPIYGRGDNNVQDLDADPNLKIPVRPYARRVENLRPNSPRSAFGNSMGDMIRRLTRGRLDLSETVHESAGRTGLLLNRFLTSRAIMREQNLEATPDDSGYLNGNLEAEDDRRPQSLQFLRTHSHRATLPSFSSAVNSAEGVVETYFRTRNQEQAEQPVRGDDRDSYSNIAADLNSESQVDTAVEIESMVSLPTSSSRRRNDSPRDSDVDNGGSLDLRVRRRRLH